MYCSQGNVPNLIRDKDDSDDDDGFIAKEEEPQPLQNEPDDVSYTSLYIQGGVGGGVINKPEDVSYASLYTT